MRYSFLVIAIVGVSLAVFLLWRGSRLPETPLAGGRKLVVLKVSYGTNHLYSLEPGWKRFLRRALPAKLERPLGPEMGLGGKTMYDSLIVWVQELDFGSGTPVGNTINIDNAPLGESGPYMGRRHQFKDKISWLELHAFARASNEIPIHILDGSDSVSFFVTNPNPTQPAVWTPLPLPQTNVSGPSVFLLTHFAERPSNAEADMNLRLRSPAGMGAGWTQWRVRAFDRLGNWSGQLSGWSASPRVKLFPRADGDWKLVAEAQEYVSAGFVAVPTKGSCLPLKIEPRARELGVEYAVLLGPGHFILSSIGAVERVDAVTAGSTSIGFAKVDSWEAEVVAPQSGILIASKKVVNLQTARLRERVTPDDGRIFSGQMSMLMEQNGRRLDFIQVNPPSSATNLEAELIFTHHPTEFFVRDRNKR